MLLQVNSESKFEIGTQIVVFMSACYSNASKDWPECRDDVVIKCPFQTVAKIWQITLSAGALDDH